VTNGKIDGVNEAEDNLIMEAAKGGDLEGIGLLFERYHGELVRYFRQLSRNAQWSEDLAQETFWRILRYKGSFDAKRSFRAWMFQIGRNVFHDGLRKKKNETRLSEDQGGDLRERLSQTGTETRSEVERLERADLLQKALHRLPTDKRELIVLCRFEELPHVEIAEILGCSIGAVKVRLFRALQELKSVLGELSGELKS